ncbi:hypothetical protein QAD02_007858 [Eretmocerus hayati]|uniref:Uncharacterized protein n=1 Tax=Eretmocerus hayati TaxID=131215 RepID=A0ACC2N5M9_9HYME|nr:hypothetical protein QAD02_007858 [Eretmocerus hayati]
MMEALVGPTEGQDDRSSSRAKQWESLLDKSIGNNVGEDDPQLDTSNGVTDYETDHEYERAETPSEAQSLFAGFIARKIDGFTLCPACRLSCRSENVHEDRDRAIALLTRGSLIVPSDNLFALTKLLEDQLQKVIGNHSLNQDTVFQALYKVSQIKIPLIGCNDHAESLSKTVLQYYLVTRASQMAKVYNRLNNEKKKKPNNVGRIRGCVSYMLHCTIST